MIRSNVVLPEPLSPRMVRNSPSATCREMLRNTGFFPNHLAILRMSSNGGDGEETAAVVGSLMVANIVLTCLGCPSLGSAAFWRDRVGFVSELPRPVVPKCGTTRTGHPVYCAAFTSFQISLYLARRGTFCQK